MTPAGRLAFHQRRAHEVERERRFRAIAYHEAAHCIVAAYLGINVSTLRVGLDDGMECGRCEHDALSGRDRAVLLAAGVVGEHRAAGAAMFHFGDDAQLRALDLPAADIARARADAAAIVTRHWPIVCALAEALVDAGGILEEARSHGILARSPAGRRSARSRQSPV